MPQHGACMDALCLHWRLGSSHQDWHLLWLPGRRGCGEGFVGTWKEKALLRVKEQLDVLFDHLKYFFKGRLT